MQIFLLEYVDRYLKNAVLQNPDLSPGTVRNYRKAINHFKTFLTKNGKQKILLEEVDHTLSIEFKDYLQSNKLDEEKKGMSEVSASSIVKNLKPIFNRAVAEGHLKTNPLMVLKLHHKSARRDRLTIGHVKALHKLKLAHSPSLQAYRDLFLFSVYTGLAYQDAIGLRSSNLENRENG